MTDQEIQQRAKRFFAMLASHGVTKVLMAEPPEGSGAEAEITKGGDIVGLDTRTNKKRKIKIK